MANPQMEEGLAQNHAIAPTFLKGGLIGLVEAIPGVSAGSIALMTGLYPVIIDAISALKPKTFKNVFNKKTRFRDALHARTMIPVILGMIPGLWLGATLLGHLLTEYRPAVMGLFTGLLACGGVLTLMIRSHLRLRYIAIWGALGITGGILFSVGLPALLGREIQTSLFTSGLLAAPAMLLPGVSGSFLLLLLGNYETMLKGVSTGDLSILLPLYSGFIVGGLMGVHIINHLMNRYSSQLTALMGGLMLGSLPALWPWQLEANNVLPATWESFHQSHFIPNHPGSVSLLIVVGICASVVVAGYWGTFTSKIRQVMHNLDHEASL